MKRAVLVACLVGLAACTTDETVRFADRSAASPTPVAAAPHSPTPTAVASPSAVPVVDVNTTSVADVAIGTRAAEAERRLRAELGTPSMSEPLPGCYGESGQVLVWDTLVVYLSDSASGPVVLTGWNVVPGVSRYRWRLPYDVATGDGMRKALADVPGAVGAVPSEGENTLFFVVRTDRAPGLTWTSTTADEDGRVAKVDFRGEGCD